MEGWFIAGIKAPTGDISYHLPMRLWEAACETGASVMHNGMAWDGHTSPQVIERLVAWSDLLADWNVADTPAK
jgi:hypothetical protein